MAQYAPPLTSPAQTESGPMHRSEFVLNVEVVPGTGLEPVTNGL